MSVVDASDNSGAVLWHPNSASQLRWRCWDGEWVIYDTGSGQTHLVDSFSAAVLGLIESHPQTQSRLMATLSDHLSERDRASLPDALAVTLRSLEAIGLVDPIPA